MIEIIIAILSFAAGYLLCCTLTAHESEDDGEPAQLMQADDRERMQFDNFACFDGTGRGQHEID